MSESEGAKTNVDCGHFSGLFTISSHTNLKRVLMIFITVHGVPIGHQPERMSESEPGSELEGPLFRHCGQNLLGQPQGVVVV